MPDIVVMRYPAEVILETTNNPTGTFDQGEGEFPVYTVTGVRWTNLVDRAWNVEIVGVGPTWTGVIPALDVGSVNLAGPRRFDSWPLDYIRLALG